jgi:uncharacterized membrane protein
MERFLTIMLLIHIIGGMTALLTGLVSMLTRKGGKNHKLSGKLYFGGMSTVFLTAIPLSIGHNKPFLLMVAFFSYYMVVRGYRILQLKKLWQEQKIPLLDWAIMTISGIFMLGLLGWGIMKYASGNSFGIVAIVFGAIGCGFVVLDLRKFTRGTTDKMHWWFTHIGSMGGGYIATLTAFIVTNVRLSPAWVLWLLPTVVGSVIISLTIRKYKIQFAAKKGL